MPLPCDYVLHHCQHFVLSHVALEREQLSSRTSHQLETLGRRGLSLVLGMDRIRGIRARVGSAGTTGMTGLIASSRLLCRKIVIVILPGSHFVQDLLVCSEYLADSSSCLRGDQPSVSPESVLQLSDLILLLLDLSHIFVPQLFHHH